MSQWRRILHMAQLLSWHVVVALELYVYRKFTDVTCIQVPEGEDWESVRHFLQNVQNSFRSGDIKSGAKALYRIIPFVQRAISNTEKVRHPSATAVAQHFAITQLLIVQHLNKISDKCFSYLSSGKLVIKTPKLIATKVHWMKLVIGHIIYRPCR